MAGKAYDPELDLTSTPTDLHTLRSIDHVLNTRAFTIQEKSSREAVEEILRSDEFAPRIKTMKFLVTGGAGYLGWTLAATLRGLGADVVTMDVVSGSSGEPVDLIGSVSDLDLVCKVSQGCDVVFNTAALHAPHATSRHEEEFIDVNIGGIKNILSTEVPVVIHTSTTSLTITQNVKALEKSNQCVWLDETANSPSPPGTSNIAIDKNDEPRNKYGRTKKAAEKLCIDAAASPTSSCSQKKSIVVLRTSRFFCEELLEDSDLSLANSMANELLGRRAALVDIVVGHIKAMLRATRLSGNVYVLSAPWPFTKEETPVSSAELVAELVKKHYGSDAFQDAMKCCKQASVDQVDSVQSFKLPSRISRIYDSSAACRDFDWKPLWTFETLLHRMKQGQEVAMLGLY